MLEVDAYQVWLRFKIYLPLNAILHLIIECKIGGANYPLLIDHISQEAIYFLKLLQKICDGSMECPVDSIVSDNVFWLRHIGRPCQVYCRLACPIRGVNGDLF